MTPNELDILLHCHIRRCAHPRSHAQAVKEAYEEFVIDGIIKLVPEVTEVPIYQLTEKGEAWMRLILNTPEPVQLWVDPRIRREEDVVE